MLDPDLLAEPYGAAAARVWARARLRDRIDAIIDHELTEFDAGSHEGALELAPETDCPITERARKILNAMKVGWKR